MKDQQKKELREFIEKLDSIRGRHTELVTVYVPAGYELTKIVVQLRSEQSTSENIKSKTVRKNVTGAIERILQHLKLYKATPPNGMAIFAGNISDKEGVTDIQVFVIEPPEPVRTKLYHCGQTFILDPLKENVAEKEIYGLLVFDKQEANIGLIKGKTVENIKRLESIVPGKTSKGGQSAARFERVREGMIMDFMKEIAELATKTFRDMPHIKGIIIAGPGPSKDDFMKEEYLPTDIRSKVIGIVSTSYTGDYGLKEAFERSDGIIAEAGIMKEKKILEKFFEGLAKSDGLSVYGVRPVVDAIKSGNLDLLLISEKFDSNQVKLRCECGNEIEKMIIKKKEKIICQKCGKDMKVIESREIMSEIIKAAEQISSRVEIISAGTPKGEQFLELSGIGGILRYRA